MNPTYRQEQVLRLQIAMGNLVFVAEKHGVKQDYANISGFFFVVVTLLNNSVKQLSSHHLFGHQVIELSLIEHIVESNDVFVLQLLQDGDFVFEGDFILLRKLRFGDNLDRKRVMGLSVGSFLYDRESTFSQLQT